jgi:hypothetical protein
MAEHRGQEGFPVEPVSGRVGARSRGEQRQQAGQVRVAADRGRPAAPMRMFTGPPGAGNAEAFTGLRGYAYTQYAAVSRSGCDIMALP